MRIYEKKEGLSAEFHQLVSFLVDQHGYILSQQEWEEIIGLESYDADSFAHDILIAEGLEVEENQSLFRTVRNLYIQKFGNSVSLADYDNDYI